MGSLYVDRSAGYAANDKLSAAAKQAGGKKPRKPLLTWSKRPTRSHDREMGWRRRWLSRGQHKYAITQYVELSAQFICTVWELGGWSLLATKATLAAAKKLCEADAKKAKE